MVVFCSVSLYICMCGCTLYCMCVPSGREEQLSRQFRGNKHKSINNLWYIRNEYSTICCHAEETSYCTWTCWRSIVNCFNLMWIWSNTFAGEHKSKERLDLLNSHLCLLRVKLTSANLWNTVFRWSSCSACVSLKTITSLLIFSTPGMWQICSAMIFWKIFNGRVSAKFQSGISIKTFCVANVVMIFWSKSELIITSSKIQFRKNFCLIISLNENVYCWNRTFTLDCGHMHVHSQTYITIFLGDHYDRRYPWGWSINFFDNVLLL